MSVSALHDVVVVELSSGVAGSYAARLLNELGATTFKVESARGDPLRQERPLLDSTNGQESAFYAWLNAGKHSVVLPLVDQTDRRIEELYRHADIVFHSERGSQADFLEEKIRSINSLAVVISVTPYGRSGSRKDWLASPLTEYATGGYHFFSGDPEREPIALPGYQVEFHAAQHAALAALAGFYNARSTGEGQLVELSHQEAILSDHAWLTTMWTHQGKVQEREGSTFIPCLDGYVFLFHLVPYPNLFALIERFDLLEDETWQQPQVWQERYSEVIEAFTEWAKDRTKQAIYQEAQNFRIAVTPLNDMADVLKSEQLLARDWFRSLSVAGKTFSAPGAPYKLSRTPCTHLSASEAVGASTDLMLDDSFPWPIHENIVTKKCETQETNKSNGPLAGLRVIEVTANWAGPIAGRHFADLGADVIKIELDTKPATRALAYVPADIWPDHYHRSGYFNKLNRNKRAICLNLATTKGRSLFLKLIESVDVVLENNAARVMKQLGLSYDVLSEYNPALVMCSLSGFGATGPERNYSAYGSNIETISGLASVLGYKSGDYYTTGSFYADPTAGNHAAISILAAVHAARRDGEGQWIDLSLLEAVLPFFSQELLTYTSEGVVASPQGNNSEAFYLQGVFPTAGADCWIAIALRTKQEAVFILNLLTNSVSPIEDIEEVIRAWALQIDHISASDFLQANGITAAPVMPNWEIVSDNHLNDRGYFCAIRHPVAGTHLFPGFPWRFSKTPASVYRPAPLFAEHNHEVFSSLGLSSIEIENLIELGVTAEEPVYGEGPSL